MSEEINYQEIEEQLALVEEESIEEHQFVDADVELVDEAEVGIMSMMAAFTVPGVTFKDVRNSLRKGGTYFKRTLASIKKIVVHHSATVTGSAEAYARYHVDSLGWPGIGYHIVIEQDGTVKYCNDLERISYHSGNANSYSVGICLTGDFSKNKPTAAQFVSLYKVIAALQNYLPYARNPIDVIGHQECPGYAWKLCPSLDMDAMRGEIQKKSYGQVANKYSNDQSIVVKTGASTGSATPPAAPAGNYVLESNRIGTVTVLATDLNLREKDDVNSKVIKTLNKGTSWKCYGEGKWGWKLGNGYVGKGAQYTSFSAHVAVAEILVDSLNVRTDASFTAPIVQVNGKDKVLTKGTRWKVYEQKNGLLRVGINQWISAGDKYVRLTSA